MRNQFAIISFILMAAANVFGGVYSGGVGSEIDPTRLLILMI